MAETPEDRAARMRAEAEADADRPEARARRAQRPPRPCPDCTFEGEQVLGAADCQTCEGTGLLAEPPEWLCSGYSAGPARELPTPSRRRVAASFAHYVRLEIGGWLRQQWETAEHLEACKMLDEEEDPDA